MHWNTENTEIQRDLGLLSEMFQNLVILGPKNWAWYTVKVHSYTSGQLNSIFGTIFAYRLRSEICGFIVLYLWIYCLYLHIYRRCLIYYICWQQILLLYFLEKILLYYQHILLKYSYISNQSCCSWKTTRSVDYIDYISTYHIIAITIIIITIGYIPNQSCCLFLCIRQLDL